MEYRQLLQLLQKQGIINNGNIHSIMTIEEKRQIISKHPYKIFLGNDGRYKTYLAEPNSKSGRRLIAKKSLEAIEKIVIEEFFKNQRESLMEVYKQISVETQDNNFKDNRNIKEIYSEWLEYKSTQTDSASYIYRIHCDWKKYYEGTELIYKPVKELTYVYLNKWAYDLIKQYDLTKKQYYNITIIVRQLLDFCTEPEINLIEQNPFERVKFKSKMFRKDKQPASETQVFSDKEREQIIKIAFGKFKKRPKYTTPLAIILNFTLGLRIGELCVLKKTDITGRHLLIQRSMIKDFEIMYGNEVSFEPKEDRIVERTKSPAGERTLYLTNFAMEILKLLEETNERYGYYDNDFLFVSCYNQRTSEGTIENYLWKLCKEAGIKVPKGNHKIRKTFISSLFDANININTIREIAGHESEQTTLKNYCFDRTEKSVTESKLDKIFDSMKVS